ncbi:MAG: plastocyanin/azurin family copper-binding protein [Solirubrobacterales bacterium]
MRMKFLASMLGVLAFLALGAVASGCGSSDDSSSTSAESSEAAESSTTTSAPAAGGETLTVKMNEYNFIPDDAKAKAGSVTIDAENVGKMPHELVLAKSDLDPAKLPTTSDGSVDEEALDTVGEAPDVAPGDTGSFTADLEPGSYVMFCNLPGHYASGMYGSLTVK